MIVTRGERAANATPVYKYLLMQWRWCAHRRIILNKHTASIVLDAYLHNKRLQYIIQFYEQVHIRTKLDLLLLYVTRFGKTCL